VSKFLLELEREEEEEADAFLITEIGRRAETIKLVANSRPTMTRMFTEIGCDEANVMI
jgi:hypothetical protein